MGILKPYTDDCCSTVPAVLDPIPTHGGEGGGEREREREGK